MEPLVGIEEEILLEQKLINIADLVNRPRKRYTIRQRSDNINQWSDEEFIRRYRVSKVTVQNILDQIGHHLIPLSTRRHNITPLQQLLLTLRYLATGSLYICIADYGGIHKSTFGRIVRKVIFAIAALRENYIRFSRTNDEKEEMAISFHRLARFPKVIGAIDCTHVKIQSPGGNIAENFRNRKGYFSLNVQAICNSQNYFTDIVARWPGSSHDSMIFNNSTIRMRFEAEEFGNFVLLGDSGYPLRNYILTPIEQPNTPAEQLYNEAQIRTRNVIERTFGIWKRRFPILSIGIRTKLPLTQATILLQQQSYIILLALIEMLYLKMVNYKKLMKFLKMRLPIEIIM